MPSEPSSSSGEVCGCSSASVALYWGRIVFIDPIVNSDALNCRLKNSDLRLELGTDGGVSSFVVDDME